MKKHFNIKVSGLVQGVFFRTSTKEMAEKLRITGFARNEPDNSVYIEAEGKEKDLQAFLDWCKKGPPSAKVQNLEIKKGTLKNFSGFLVF